MMFLLVSSVPSRRLESTMILVVLSVSGSCSTQCPPQTYHDPAVDRCELCSQLCTYADIQGTMQDCETKCPDYNHEVTMTTKNGKTTRKVTTNDLFEGGDTQTKDRHHILLIPVFVGVGICVCIVVVTAAILLYKGKDSRRQHAAEKAVLRFGLLKNGQGHFIHRSNCRTNSSLI